MHDDDSGKMIFPSIYDGTLPSNWKGLITFQQMILLADRKKGIVDITPEAMSARTGIPLEILTEGIAFLEQPDPDSRNPTKEGRRIERLDAHRDWGWTIVNFAHYRKLQRMMERRAYHRAYYLEKKAEASPQPCDHDSDATSAINKELNNLNTFQPSPPPEPLTTSPEPLTDPPTSAENKTFNFVNNFQLFPTDLTYHPSEEELREEKDLRAEGEPNGAVPRSSPLSEPLHPVAPHVPSEWMLEFKKIYPSRAGDPAWREAIRAANARMKEGHTPAEFLAGAQRYAAFITATGKVGTEYVKQASTFLGPSKHFLLPWVPPPKPENATTRLLRKLGSTTGRLFDHET